MKNPCNEIVLGNLQPCIIPYPAVRGATIRCIGFSSIRDQHVAYAHFEVFKKLGLIKAVNTYSVNYPTGRFYVEVAT